MSTSPAGASLAGCCASFFAFLGSLAAGLSPASRCAAPFLPPGRGGRVRGGVGGGAAGGPGGGGGGGGGGRTPTGTRPASRHRRSRQRICKRQSWRYLRRLPRIAAASGALAGHCWQRAGRREPQSRSHMSQSACTAARLTSHDAVQRTTCAHLHVGPCNARRRGRRRQCAAEGRSPQLKPAPSPRLAFLGLRCHPKLGWLYGRRRLLDRGGEPGVQLLVWGGDAKVWEERIPALTNRRRPLAGAAGLN